VYRYEKFGRKEFEEKGVFMKKNEVFQLNYGLFLLKKVSLQMFG